MNNPLPPPVTAAECSPREAIAVHFRLSLLGVVAHLIAAATGENYEATVATYPFLADYVHEMGTGLQSERFDAEDWRRAVQRWEATRSEALPLRALRAAGLEALDIELLLAAGLIDEDPRFGNLFEAATSRERRPTLGLLMAWWRVAADGADRVETVRRSLLALIRNGLLTVPNPDAPRAEWTLVVVPALWDAIHGELPSLPWLRFTPCDKLLPIDDYIVGEATGQQCRRLPELLAAQPLQLLLVRGAPHNGRKTLAGCIACQLGLGLLVADGRAVEDEARWHLFGTLATLLNAMPLVELPLVAGENRNLPRLPLAGSPLAVVSGVHGGIQCADGRPILAISLPLPGRDERRLHWRAAAVGQSNAGIELLAANVRLSSGNIRRAAPAALAYAALEGREAIDLHDVRLASRALHGARLETLASRIGGGGSLAELALDETTREEMDSLRLRCQHREALAAADAGVGGSGVRALFAGASGTGKTHAARLLAATLGKDLYRIDLSATVNKYLGETEKNLEAALAAAEELDVVLLLDEGDALMSQRTDVGSANDRYANLETNFLLQRIETFGGILIVTTNAADRIDKAFARRMDVVIAFRAPDELRRYEILRILLGPVAIDENFLQDVAWRCLLTGGQMRNVVSHAQLLALQAQHPPTARELHLALLREYRKIGAHCPLKNPAPTGSGF